MVGEETGPDGDQPYPRYGNGLLLVQSFPAPGLFESEGGRLALGCNAAELIKGPFSYGSGSYLFRDDMLQFSGFLPNVAYCDEMLANLYFACAGRARHFPSMIPLLMVQGMGHGPI